MSCIVNIIGALSEMVVVEIDSTIGAKGYQQ